MSRPLRMEYAGALWHVTSRGDRQEDAERRLFLSVLGDVFLSYTGVSRIISMAKDKT